MGKDNFNYFLIILPTKLVEQARIGGLVILVRPVLLGCIALNLCHVSVLARDRNQLQYVTLFGNDNYGPNNLALITGNTNRYIQKSSFRPTHNDFK